MSTKTKALQTAQPTGRRKRISLADVKQIAQLTECQRLSYKEATALLGINYEVWRNWKDRAKNQPRFDDIIARVKASYLRGRLANIEDAERGRHGHRADWRASKALLEIADATRYATPSQPQPEAPKVAVSPSVVNVWVQLARESGSWAKSQPAAVVDVPARQLPENSGPGDTEGAPPPEQDQRQPPEPRRVGDKVPSWWKMPASKPKADNPPLPASPGDGKGENL